MRVLLNLIDAQMDEVAEVRSAVRKYVQSSKGRRQAMVVVTLPGIAEHGF